MKFEHSGYVADFGWREDADWDRIFQQFDDANVWQTGSYGRLAFGPEQLDHALLYKDGQLVSAAQIGLVKIPFVRAQFAYVKYGPLWRPCGRQPDPEALRSMVRSLIDHYVGQQRGPLRVMPRVSGDIIGDIPALLQNSQIYWRGLPAGGTYLLDLSPSTQDLLRQMRPRWRQHLNKSIEQDLRSTELDPVTHLDDFLEHYRAMRLRKNFIDVSEFDLLPALQTDLPDAFKLKLFGCFHGEEMVATFSCWVLGDTAIGLFASTDETGRRLGASYVLDWWLVQWLKQRGYRWFDLGGAGDPDVNRYKRGLTGRELSEVTFAGKFDFHSSRSVLAALSLAETVRVSSRYLKARWKRP